MTRTDPNTKTVAARYAELETTVEPDLINGGHVVRLNPDAGKLPGTLTTLASYEARELARDLLAQADEADERDGTGTKGSFQVTDNITGQPVRGGLSQDAASHLCRGLNLAAGPGGRYRVDPDAAQLTPERCDIHGGRSLAACDHGDIAQLLARVHEFMADQLGRDDMSLEEIAGQVITMVLEG